MSDAREPSTCLTCGGESYHHTVDCFTGAPVLQVCDTEDCPKAPEPGHEFCYDCEMEAGS